MYPYKRVASVLVTAGWLVVVGACGAVIVFNVNSQSVFKPMFVGVLLMIVGILVSDIQRKVRCTVRVNGEAVREWYPNSEKEIELAKGLAESVAKKSGLNVEIECKEVNKQEG